MTTEKQTPEALAAEIKRQAEAYASMHTTHNMRCRDRLSVWDLSQSCDAANELRDGLNAAIDQLASLASAQAQQEPPVAHGVFVGTRLVKLEESAQLAGEWAQREIVRGSPLTYHIRSLYTAPPVQQAEPLALNGIKATMFHDEGAIAQCGYCRRYSLDPKTLGDRQPACECGEKHGWSGSFKKPGADAQWSGARPACAPQPERAGVVPNGWKLVPVALTEEMIRAGGFTPSGSLRGAWADMLNAAPPAPAVGKRESLTLHQISDAAREAQIAFCLDKYTSFEVALARAIERAHGITPADAKEGIK